MSPKRPGGVERWWNVKKLPTGKTVLSLDPRKLRGPLAWDLGFKAVGIGFTAWALRSVSPALALASTVGSLVMAGRSMLRRQPTRWCLSPGRSVLEDWNGKRRAYVPARVILMKKEHPDWSDDGRTFHRTSHVSYALFVETVQGKKIAVHRGLPYRDVLELTHTIAEALGVHVEERQWFGIHVGPITVHG
ncbi:MAG TPA: hypothetical protein VFA20_25805 [Myxococcaceae bacterium]|nr:hypothetical protein [Myxococcaceae bacterium]